MYKFDDFCRIDDTIDLEAGDDYAVGGAAADEIYGREGMDTIVSIIMLILEDVW